MRAPATCTCCAVRTTAASSSTPSRSSPSTATTCCTSWCSSCWAETPASAVGREHHRGGVRLALADIGDGDLVAGAMTADGGDQRLGAGDDLVADLGDDIAPGQSGLLGGGAVLDRLDSRAGQQPVAA